MLTPHKAMGWALQCIVRRGRCSCCSVQYDSESMPRIKLLHRCRFSSGGAGHTQEELGVLPAAVPYQATTTTTKHIRPTICTAAAACVVGVISTQKAQGSGSTRSFRKQRE